MLYYSSNRVCDVIDQTVKLRPPLQSSLKQDIRAAVCHASDFQDEFESESPTNSLKSRLKSGVWQVAGLGYENQCPQLHLHKVYKY